MYLTGHPPLGAPPHEQSTRETPDQPAQVHDIRRMTSALTPTFNQIRRQLGFELGSGDKVAATPEQASTRLWR